MQQKTAAVVVIGNEILTGKSEDKNASYLIGELYKLGVALRRVVVIADDVTIEGVARAFDRPVVRIPELEAMLRSYFGEGVNEARLRMADAPDGSQLIKAAGLRWPVLATENVYVLPGVPELFRSKFEAIRERFRGDPYFVGAVYTREDEFDLASRLDRVAANHPDVDIGSYPTFTREDYRVKVTIESKVEAAVDRARSELLALLDPAAIFGSE